MTIKAIETEVFGYRFRSRLEARWAIFLDAIGASWEYEPEGFEGKGYRYLPDFLIHYFEGGVRIYIEVKPPTPIPKKETRKLYRFASDLTESSENIGFLVAKGDPANDDGFVFGTFCGSKKMGIMGSIDLFSRLYGTDIVSVAALKARSARFEHGETPNV